MIYIKCCILAMCLVLSGCNIDNTYWDNAEYRYACTEEEYQRALKEAKQAKAEDDKETYWRWFLGTAIMRICTIKPEYEGTLL
jgi:hypothetical protein